MGKSIKIAFLALFALSLTISGLFSDIAVVKAASIENKVFRVWVTAYSSSPEETDETPFITASGGTVRDGVIAANFLPFGTRVKIPELFGDKIFVVEDRMHRRKINFVDVWMASKNQAKKVGINYSHILVLN